ncbi:MAG: hypothetical protein HWE27_09930 [Gammaproteobacteria bacterium]|nr:hypothetical protein [Gammaproteobacteria bacterium]
MKLAIRSIQIVTGLMLIFLSIGMFVPEFAFSTTVTSKSSLDSLASTLEQPENVIRWSTGYSNVVDSSEQNNELDGVDKSDSSAFESSSGEKANILHLKWLSESNLSASVKAKHFSSNAKVYLIDANGKTELQFEHHIIPHGVFWKSVLFFQKSSIQEKIEDSIENLFSDKAVQST